MVCDENGMISSNPYFQQCNANGSPHGRMAHGRDAANDEQADAESGTSRPRKRRRRGKGSGIEPSKLLPSSRLFDAERSRLHLEMYNYVSWLRSELVRLQSTSDGRRKVTRAGMLVPAMENLLRKFETAFRNVREFAAEERERREGGGDSCGAEAGASGVGNVGGGEAAASLNNQHERDGEGGSVTSGNENDEPTPSKLPLLERCMETELKRTMEEEDARKAEERNNCAQIPASGKDGASPDDLLDFDAMFDRLAAYGERNGRADVGARYEDDDGVPLGRWAQRLREEREDLRSRGLEHEASPPPGEGDVVTLRAPPGRLGLTLRFSGSDGGGKEGGALITGVSPACAFGDKVSVGDRLVTVDGAAVSTIEDLEGGEEEERGFRTLGIAKNCPHHRTHLSRERVVSLERYYCLFIRCLPRRNAGTSLFQPNLICVLRSPFCQERLDSIGFNWTTLARKSYEEAWEESFQLLKRFKESHGRWPKNRESWEGVGRLSVVSFIFYVPC